VQDAAQKCHYCGAPIPHLPRQDRVAPPLPVAPAPSRSLGFAAMVIGALVAFVVVLLIAYYR
jgi:hypothetical protein